MGARKSELSRPLAITGIVLAFLFMLAGFSVYLAPHLGWRVDGLRSGSMAPLLEAGDLIVTRPAAPETVKVGDIIIFHSVDKADILLSHRVVSIEMTPVLSFRTKGDANEASDPFAVAAGNLIGELAFHAPLLGYLVIFLKTVSGLLVSLVIPGVVIIAICLKSLRNELAGKTKGNISG